MFWIHKFTSKHPDASAISYGRPVMLNPNSKLEYLKMVYSFLPPGVNREDKLGF